MTSYLMPDESILYVDVDRSATLYMYDTDEGEAIDSVINGIYFKNGVRVTMPRELLDIHDTISELPDGDEMNDPELDDYFNRYIVDMIDSIPVTNVPDLFD